MFPFPGSQDPKGALKQVSGIFGQANVALTRWVKEGVVFILIRVLKWNHVNSKIRVGNWTKSESPTRQFVQTTETVSQTYFSCYRTISPKSPRLNAFGLCVQSSRKLQCVCSGSTMDWRCVGLATGQCATHVSLPENIWCSLKYNSRGELK